MNILMTYIRKYLWGNKTSTLTSILSIMTASALFFVVCCLSVNSLIGIHEASIDVYGNYHALYEEVDESFIHSMNLHQDVKETHLVEFQKRVHTDSFVENDKNAFALIGMKQSDFDQLGLILEEGRYPENEHEVLLSNTVLDDTKLSLDVGKTLQLENETYLIVGIADTPFLENNTQDHVLITKTQEKGKKLLYVCYKNPTNAKEITSKITENFSEHFTYSHVNELSILTTNLINPESTTVFIWVILFLLFFFFCINLLLIRSAYHNSYSNREKHLAILKTVGVTQSQCKMMILYEGLLILVISLLLGSLVGIVLYTFFIKFINDLLLSISLRSFTLGFNYVFTCWVVMCVYIILSGLFFMKRSISRIVSQSVSSTLQTSEEVVLVNQPYLQLDRKMSLFRRLFRKNIIQNYRNYTHLVVGFTLVVSLLLLINTFMGYLRDAGVYDVNDYNYDVEAIVMSENYPTSFMTKLKNSSASNVVISEKLFVECRNFSSFDEKYQELHSHASIQILSYHDEVLSHYLSSFSKTNIHDLNNKGIFINQTFSPAHRRFYSILKDDYLSNIQIGDELINLDVLLSEHLITGTGFQKTPQLIVTNEKMNEYFKMSGNETHEYHIYFSSNDPTSLVRELSAMDESGLEEYMLINANENQKDSKSLVTLIRLFVYSYLVCLFVMSILGVCCVASVNFDYRKKEFALYHVLGMTYREMMKLIFVELLFYVLQVFVSAWIISQFLNYLLYHLYIKQLGLSFFIPKESLIGIFLSVIMLLSVVMCYIYLRLKAYKNSSVLKNEISLM